jgi:hypothetical protein
MGLGKAVGFLETRNLMMLRLGWDRRVATLAARLLLGIDTWDSIASTPSFRGKPLLNSTEAATIKKELES